jgi:hypothetical protein
VPTIRGLDLESQQGGNPGGLFVRRGDSMAKNSKVEHEHMEHIEHIKFILLRASGD